MKKLLLATTLFAAFGAAQAVTVVLDYDSNEGPSGPYTGVLFDFSGTKLNQAIAGNRFTSGTNYGGDKGGSLYITDAPAELTFTYLGKEAGHRNSFTFDLEGTSVGTFATNSSTSGVSAFEVSLNELGYLELTFKDVTTGKQAFSGYAGTNDRNSWFGFLEVSEINFGMGAGEYDYLILFNDDYADNDYNDMVVGVKAVQAIPEPETYALMLAGLGVVGFMARRRRQV
jgi:hypothetical protein